MSLEAKIYEYLLKYGDSGEGWYDAHIGAKELAEGLSVLIERESSPPADTNSHEVRRARGAMVPDIDLEAHERDMERRAGCGGE